MVQAFARAIEGAGGKALLVGGIVRDGLLGLPSKDVDFEIFGLPMEKVQEVLSRFGNVKEVGEQFGVLMIQDLDWDVALPRREQKTGEGHRGFDVVPDPTMSIEDAARRRDFTINSMSMDPLTGEVIDPLNGIADLKAGILRMSDPNSFGDDPLRALRAAQFAARFDFDIEPETLKVVAAQPLEQLPGERILPEFSKMLLKGKTPSKGIEVLHQANLLRYFPEIEALQGVPQEPKWHPEGDVYVHTLLVLDEAAKQRTGDPEFDLPLMLGALAHDFGKPGSTEEIDGHITSRGHEEAGIEPTRAFLGRMKAPLALTKQVETLVDAHLRPAILPGTSGRKGYRKLGRTLGDADVSPELLAALSKADVLGRTTEDALRRDVSSQDKFLEEYHQHVTSVAAPGGKLVDSVSGKHLIAKGFKPGPDMGKFLALTRSIEDETAITDPDKLIELATRFLSDRSEEGGSQKENENKCGDSHIRPGEECFDGNYREMRKQGKTKSGVFGTGVGPSAFRTNPDKTQDDFLLWDLYEWPADEKGESQHPGLATAEPQRLHKRAEEYPGVKDFDRGSRFSVHPLEGPLGRDGFGGSTPHQMEELEPSPNGMTPETGVFPNWEDLGTADIGPDHRQPFPGSEEFPKSEYPNDKGAGFLATELPIPQMLDDTLPHPSPTRSAEESPPSSFPGQIVRKPGGGGLDRAPMIKPRGADQETGFLPVQNYPDPERNMFKACAQEELLPGGRADGMPDSDFNPKALKTGTDIEVWEHGVDRGIAKEVTKDHLVEHPDFYDNHDDADKAAAALNPRKVHGPGGQNPGGDDMNHGERQRGGRGGGTKIRPYWDMDFTGKKSGFMSIEEPEENIYPAATEAARTMEDLMDIDTIFPKEYSTPLEEERPGIGPSIKHRNERHVAPDPIQSDDDANVEQKQVQPLVPNQKMAIAVDPKGPMGERIVIMSPLFEEASPAIMALRSHRFERHGGIVIDGPPEWLLGITPRLEALDKSSGHDGADDLFARVQQLIQSAGMPIEYEQQPRP
jgi:tRNA nucleotidyltransferase (CCA-adding enzyme)